MLLLLIEIDNWELQKITYYSFYTEEFQIDPENNLLGLHQSFL